ncbi:MAG: hypothetical protein H7249_04310 [Chitinophagaceae bacterium]|nr:hypothetical protein [Oligoflexus sp.]
MAEQRMKKAKEDSTALKHFFGKDLLKRIAKAIVRVYPAFDAKTFLSIARPLEDHEMKVRVRMIRDQLKALYSAFCESKRQNVRVGV